jgi:excisionase family DNA binding protein
MVFRGGRRRIGSLILGYFLFRIIKFSISHNNFTNRQDCFSSKSIILSVPTKAKAAASMVASQLALSKPHVYDLAKSVELPSIKFGRAVRFDPMEVGDFIRAHWRRNKGNEA